jgi:hypothetical protein
MERKIKILTSILSIIIIFFFVTFVLFLKSKQRYPTEIEKLYSQFTPEMKNWVDSHLNFLGCKPKKCYSNENQFCFICKEGDTCFGYGWVERTGGKKMNPYGPTYIVTDKINVKVANFYTEGVASIFNCKNEEKNTLKCNFSLKFILKEKRVDIVLKNKNELQNVARKVCQFYENTDEIKCGENDCQCKNLLINLANEILYIVHI